MRGAHRAWQIVHHPVGAIPDAGLSQQIGRLQRLGKSWRKPPDDVVARRLAQRGDRISDHRALVLHQMRRDLAEAVTHELPAGVAAACATRG